ncbi:hypothetical protein JOF28_002296 [Leucobacter exalbidus]|uniref:Excreted virulence factor EspC, type VII ESX diderm n=1 Tax=Leucobacter exalbidus TaxID=662960 RepID=A0A940PT81_9MICO|nr:hypothetical protein [Leucobacter exalbidus]MBP1327064.1 hypothetical protein [Leucobacter exalbidus]
MNDRLGFTDAALDTAASTCEAANEALAVPARMTTPALSGVTDLPARVGEFVSTLAIACAVLGSSASSVGRSVLACKQGSDDADAQAAAALASATLPAPAGYRAP